MNNLDDIFEKQNEILKSKNIFFLIYFLLQILSKNCTLEITATFLFLRKLLLQNSFTFFWMNTLNSINYLDTNALTWFHATLLPEFVE